MILEFRSTINVFNLIFDCCFIFYSHDTGPVWETGVTGVNHGLVTSYTGQIYHIRFTSPGGRQMFSGERQVRTHEDHPRPRDATNSRAILIERPAP